MFETKEIIEIFISTYLIKALVSLIDTPFLYAGRAIFQRWVAPNGVDDYAKIA